MLKMFRNFFNDLLPYALNWREEIQIQETWIFAKFVKNPEIKPNYTSFKKFSMHTYSVGKQNFPALFPKYSQLSMLCPGLSIYSCIMDSLCQN